jgi:hypothetical protein
LVTGVYTIPEYLGGRFYYAKPLSVLSERESVEALAEARYLAARIRPSQATGQEKASGNGGVGLPEADGSDGYYERRISIRQANSMIDFIREQMIKSFRDPRPGYEPKRFIETDLFLRQLETYVRRTRRGRSILTGEAGKQVPESVARAIGKQMGKRPDQVTKRDILRFRNRDLSRLTGVDPSEVAQMKMKLLRVKLKGTSKDRYGSKEKRSR